MTQLKRILELWNVSAKKKSDTDRITSCVNSLSGIPDPAEFVAAASELLGTAIAYLEAKSTEIDLNNAMIRLQKAFGLNKEVSNG